MQYNEGGMSGMMEIMRGETTKLSKREIWKIDSEV